MSEMKLIANNKKARHEYQILDTYEAVTEEMKLFTENSVIPVVIGGDHSVTLPQLRALCKKHGPVALVHFDASDKCLLLHVDNGSELP